MNQILTQLPIATENTSIAVLPVGAFPPTTSTLPSPSDLSGEGASLTSTALPSLEPIAKLTQPPSDHRSDASEASPHTEPSVDPAAAMNGPRLPFFAVNLQKKKATKARNRKTASHRANSRFRELAEDSPVSVDQCAPGEFLMHLFGGDAQSVLMTDDPNEFHLRWTGHPGGYRYFNPVALNKDEEQRPYGNKITHADVLKLGDLQYAAFEIRTDELPEQFTLEVQTDGYPTVAIVAVDRTTVHMVCRVDATSMEHYQDRCELILRVANDDDCGRSAHQISWCSMPSVEKGNLLYLDPSVKWRLPIYTEDFA